MDKLATIDKAGGLARQAQSFAQIVRKEIGQSIAGFTDQNQFRIRFPRLGKIHLGVKRKAQSGAEYPVATDYFVLPEKLLKDQGFRETLTAMGQDPDKPKSLPVWLPSPNFWENVQSSWDCYSKTHGLLCRSLDGDTARCANPDGTYTETPCKNLDCPKAKAKECAMIHRLRVFLPDAEGVGVWQIDFKGKNSWGAVESEMGTIKSTAHGQLAGLDLKLTLEPEQRLATMENKQTRQTEQRITTIYVMHLNTAIKLRDMQDAIKEAAGRVTWDVSEVEEVSVEYDEVTEAEESAPEVECEPEQAADTQEVIDEETGECTDQTPEEIEASVSADLDEQIAVIVEAIGKVRMKAICGDASVKMNPNDLTAATVDQKLAFVRFYEVTISANKAA